MSSILQIEGLCKTYQSPDSSFCLKVDRFELECGQIWGIVGPSGCGKSTLLESLALLSCPDAVRRFIFCGASGHSEDVASLWEKQDNARLTAIRRDSFGFVHQAGNLYPFLSIRENILMPYLLRFGRGGEKRLLELADALGIRHLLVRKPECLSYGERQRAAIARALIHSPCLVLADEPTSALDPKTARQVLALFKECVQQSNTALLLVSHDHKLLKDSSIPLLEIQRDEYDPDGSHKETHHQACWILGNTPAGQAMQTDLSELNVSPPFSDRSISSPGILSLFMAWKDFFHEHLLSACGILGFAAALTPILLLAGLRFGIIDTLSQRLMNSPGTLAISPYSSIRFTKERLAGLAAHPSVSFLVPSTRTLAASVTLAGPDGKRISADLVPTAEGDPLLVHSGLAVPQNGILITRQLERSLPQVNGPQELRLFVNRMHGGRIEQVAVTFPVLGVLPDSADWKPHIYAPLKFIEAVEHYRDGFSVPEFGWPGQEASFERVYSGFRMYVKTLDDVVIMRDFLMAEGIEAYTAAREVENVQALRRALFFATALIGGVTIVGMIFSLASFSVSSVQRKEHFFAQARLMGFPALSLLLFPVGQMAVCALSAATLSLFFYGGAAAAFDVICAAHLMPGESVCRIPLPYVLQLYSGALLLSLICCVGAGKYLLRIQTAEVLRRYV